MPAADAIVKNHKHYQLTLTNANQEYSLALPSSRPLKIVCKLENLAHTARIDLTSGGSATGDIIHEGGVWHTPDGKFQIGQKTIYVQSPNAGAVLSVSTWEKG